MISAVIITAAGGAVTSILAAPALVRAVCQRQRTDSAGLRGCRAKGHKPKVYKTLKRHLTRHGHSMASYKAAYGLPANYPLVAPDYSAARSAMAKSLGLGAEGRGRAAAPAGKPARNKAAAPAEAYRLWALPKERPTFPPGSNAAVVRL